jgi:poly-gamma-glutamate capsule biosynthesis protein CapA/YwtB (metallophosphatase superfamily)
VTDIDASPLAGTKRYIHKADARLTPEYLRRHRFGAVSLANNHALDYGTEGLAQTLDVLEANGCATFGAGRSRAEAEEPLLLELNSGDMCQTIAVFAGYDHSQSAEAAPESPTAQLCPLDPARIAHRIEQLKAAHPGLLAIAFPHWGDNYAITPGAATASVASQTASLQPVSMSFLVTVHTCCRRSRPGEADGSPSALATSYSIAPGVTPCSLRRPTVSLQG